MYILDDISLFDMIVVVMKNGDLNSKHIGWSNFGGWLGFWNPLAIWCL